MTAVQQWVLGNQASQNNTPPPPPPPIIGWNNDIQVGNGLAAHTNSGSMGPDYGGSAAPFTNGVYASIVGYTAGSVKWSIVSWTPGVNGDGPPVLMNDTSPQVRVYYGMTPVPVPWGGNRNAGVLILGCSLDGVPVPNGQRLVLTTVDQFGYYTDSAWGPQ